MQQQRTGQLNCSGCNVALAYPLGAPSVRCPICTVVTPVQQIQVTCVTCRCSLLLPANTSLAMCPRCRTVMAVPASVSQSALQQAIGPTKQCVYIERPTTKDASGKKISRLCIGTKLDDDQ
ncbi:zinc finger protein, putative [Bodo saltans]|uniref:Zinc finger protein, putative n=1 Tax=Bodo saltans TaxID=75058 RepID=A0A0S4ILH2_BODSA|nr:zinc finger protein, putative [Bodo saltans]|eukprot:CUF24901.1 zinc finger protein, putative [Bodo saltans]